MKTVITYGTFDLFHVGHVRLLRRLRALGDRLLVGCSTDKFNTQKGKITAMPYEQRVEILLACRYVDAVFPEESWDQKADDILKYDARILAMGDDWAGHFDSLETLCEIVYLPRTEGISSTEIKKLIASHFREEITSILNELEIVQKRLREMAS